MRPARGLDGPSMLCYDFRMDPLDFFATLIRSIFLLVIIWCGIALFHLTFSPAAIY